jgi:Ca2+-binding RTX toxin-like protein
MADPITIFATAGDNELGGAQDDAYLLPFDTDRTTTVGTLVGSELVDLGGTDTATLEFAPAAADVFTLSDGVLTVDVGGDGATTADATFEGIETLITDGGSLDLTATSGTQYLLVDVNVSPGADEFMFGGTTAATDNVLEFDSATGTTSDPTIDLQIAAVEGVDFAADTNVAVDGGRVVFGTNGDDDLQFTPDEDLGLTLGESQDFEIDVTYEDKDDDATSFTQTFTITVDGDNSGDDVILGDGDFADPATLADDLTGTNSLGDGNDQAFLREGDDSAAGEDGDDTLVGGNGADTLNGGAGADEIFGGRGDDNGDLAFVAGNIDLTDGAEVNGVTGTNAGLLGGEGDDFIKGGQGADGIDGGAGADDLNGSDGDDIILGGDGDDEIFGDAGADALVGGAGDDTLVGGAGDDMIDASDGGRNSIFGGAGDDVIFANADKDEIAPGKGDDLIDANGGAHTFTFFADNDSNVIVDWGAGSQIDVSSFGLSEAEVEAALTTGVDLVDAVGDADFTAGGTDDSAFVSGSFSLVVDAVELTTDDFII